MASRAQRSTGATSQLALQLLNSRKYSVSAGSEPKAEAIGKLRSNYRPAVTGKIVPGFVCPTPNVFTSGATRHRRWVYNDGQEALMSRQHQSAIAGTRTRMDTGESSREHAPGDWAPAAESMRIANDFQRCQLSTKPDNIAIVVTEWIQQRYRDEKPRIIEL